MGLFSRKILFKHMFLIPTRQRAKYTQFTCSLISFFFLQFLKEIRLRNRVNMSTKPGQVWPDLITLSIA